MGAHRMMSTLLFILCISFMISPDFCQDDEDGENDHCRGVTPDNFETMLKTPGVNIQLPLVNNRQCYCNNRSLENPCAIRCNTCDTNLQSCRVYGNCCLQNDSSSSSSIGSGGGGGGGGSSSSNSSSKPSSYTTSLDCRTISNYINVLIMESCPPWYHNASTKALCENEIPSDEAKEDLAAIVTDQSNNVAYHNKHCAECNGARKICQWQVGLECKTLYYVLGALDEDEFFRLGMKWGSMCDVIQRPCHGEPVRCDKSFFKRYSRTYPYIDKCYNYGSGRKHNPSVEKKCLDQPYHPSSTVTSYQNLFKNIYCLICNREKYCGRHLSTWDTNRKAPFQFMPGFNNAGFYNRSQLTVDPGCPQNEWMDPEVPAPNYSQPKLYSFTPESSEAFRGICRPLICTEGKVLNANHCKSALSIIRGLPYRMSVLLDAKRHYKEAGQAIYPMDQDEMIDTFRDWIIEIVKPFVERLDLKVAVILEHQDIEFTPDTLPESPPNQLLLPRFVWIDFKMLTTIELFNTRDVVENAILSAFRNPMVDIAMLDLYNTTYQPHLSSYELACNTLKPEVCFSKFYGYYDINIGYINRPVTSFFESYVSDRNFIELANYLTCPFVKLSAEEVQVIDDSSPFYNVTKIVLRIGQDINQYKDTVELTEPYEINQVYRKKKDEEYYVCLELLRSKFPQQLQWESAETESRMDELVENIQYVLTGFCVTASLICLAGSVTTYWMFPSLRCVAGCNTLGLSTSLMVAQILLMVGSYIQGPSVVCTTIGVITHYSWLVMFSWTFLCCLHMLRMFTSHQLNAKSTNTRRDRKAIALNVSMSFVVPALVVLTIIVTHVVVYGEARIGYGYNACTVDNVFTIHGPLIFVTICNIVFFAIVVCKIWATRRLQQTKDFRKDFIVYIKLSTMTGMFWLLVILGEVFQNDIVRALAVVANGCQGVFIFASFTANRRVLKLYAEKFNLSCLSLGETPSSTGDGTIARSEHGDPTAT